MIINKATYGRSFKLREKNKNKIGDAAKVIISDIIFKEKYNSYSFQGAGSAGWSTGQAGVLSYYEICLKISEGAQKLWDEESKVPYAYLNDEWFSLDDTKSLKLKVKYLRTKKCKIRIENKSLKYRLII